MAEKKFVWFSKTILVAVLFEGVTLLESNMEIIQQLFGISWFHIASLALPLLMFYLRLITPKKDKVEKDNKEE